MVRSRPDVLCQGRVVCRSRQQAAIDMKRISTFIVELLLVCAFLCLACVQSAPLQNEISITITVPIPSCYGNGTVGPCQSKPPVDRGPGYMLHPGVGYYKMHTVYKNWYEARQICCKEGGHLAIINSQKEADTLVGIFAPEATKMKERAQATPFAFIGVHDLYKHGEYLTSLDKPLNTTGYDIWAPGEPNNGPPGEHCGSMNTEGRMNDIPCNVQRPFICEQELE